jgi:arylsulfatase A-like enzyme
VPAPRSSPLRCRALALWLALGALGCSLDEPDTPEATAPPSILLVVLDTVRADAVTAFGGPPGVTPAFDALAAIGTRYTRAFAPSGWTLPSHATLFTGLGIERHGVGVNGRMNLAEEFVTLAERLAEAGYQTSGFSENLMVSGPFGLGQGFHNYSTDTTPLPDPVAGPFELFERIGRWQGFDKSVPFFLFVNIFDAHDPYEVRETNSFLPPGVDRTVAASVQNPDTPGIAGTGICDALPPPDEREILRGLYLGDVHSADAKLGRILEIVRATGHRLITIVTSDHGEHLGEHQLLGHEFSVRNPALRIPLVVQGAPDLPPGESDALVTLADVSASILRWAGLEVPPDFAGRPLPPPGAAPQERELVAFFGDTPLVWPEMRGVSIHDFERHKRDHCRTEHRVFGNLTAVLRPPYKLIETPGFAPELYDLRWDPAELSDVASHHPDVVSALGRVGSGFRSTLPKGSPAPLDPEEAEALRALGYGD